MEKYDHKSIEKEITEYWKKKKVYEKVKAKGKSGKPYFFMDGPPYATGSIHMGTAMNKIIKDFYLRFWRMQGFFVWDRPGYDTHGTPIEVQVEKELGFRNKKDITKYGVAEFVAKCREFATRHIDKMNKQFEGLGVWMDWNNPYLTLRNSYIEGAWYTFKQAFQKGFLYKGSYPVHTCSRCETVVAYNEIEYKKTADVSIYMKFPVKGRKESFVIWTTTPWTIPANTGIMVHPEFNYAYVETKKGVLIVAAKLVKELMEKFEIDKYIVKKTIKGKDLEGIEYEHPFKESVPGLKKAKNGHRIVTSERYVSLDEGTGLVHTAPGHGAEDYKVGKEKGLPVISPVGIDGCFTKEAGSWLEGRYTKDMDSQIIKKLGEDGYIVKTENISHDYPFCWRCSTPLLFINVPQWFFRVSEIRDKLLSENKKVNWIPEWAGDRFDNWLENLGDWPVSRQRYWGIPLPIWECKCGNIEVIGSFEELKKKSGIKKEIDFHKPEIDNVKIKCSKCGALSERVKDVLDVWFDPGVCSWASLGYPKKKELFNKLWPSTFQVEGPDQFRGWWNSQLITSVLTFGKAPFKNVLMHGFIMDAKGAKMSKSKGNIVSPDEVVNKYGVDVLRFYILNSQLWDDFYWNWNAVKDTQKAFNIFWNVYQFILNYATRPGKAPMLELEDKWVISRINTVLKGVEYVKGYKMQLMLKDFKDFMLNDFSRWYIKLVRGRVSPFYNGKDRASAEYALHYVFKRVLLALAPVAPFVTEKMFLAFNDKALSVHAESFPEPDDSLIDDKLEKQMETAKQLVEAMNSFRQEIKIKLRWPVNRLYIKTDKGTENSIKATDKIIRQMGNVKEIIFKSDLKGRGWEFPGGKILFGEVMKDEAFIRELCRHIQLLRKEDGLKVKDKIKVHISSDKETESLLKERIKELAMGVGAKEVHLGKFKEKPRSTFSFEGRKIAVYFKK